MFKLMMQVIDEGIEENKQEYYEPDSQESAKDEDKIHFDILEEFLDSLLNKLKIEYLENQNQNYENKMQHDLISKILYNNQYSFQLSVFIADFVMNKENSKEKINFQEELKKIYEKNKISSPLLIASFNNIEKEFPKIIEIIADLIKTQYWKYLAISYWIYSNLNKKIRNFYLEKNLPILTYYDESMIIHRKIMKVLGEIYLNETNKFVEIEKKLEEYYFINSSDPEDEKLEENKLTINIDPFPWFS